MKCYADNCSSEAYCKGLCKKHYTQVERHGYILSKTIFNKNEMVIRGNYVEIILVNRECKEVARTLVDLEDIVRLMSLKWRLKKDGYVSSSKRGEKDIILHRLIMNVGNSKLVIDHINHNKLDNIKCNLRVCTKSQNNMNMQPTEQNKTGYVGVTKEDNKYRVSIQVHGDRKRLGSFKTLDEAILVRKQAELEYFGEFRYKGGN